MTQRIKATIKGTLLVWARTSAGYNLNEAADILDIEPEQLQAWEDGKDQPSIPQLRRAANLYKRPLAVFYLSEPPLAFQPMSDFRRLPDATPRRFSPALTLEIRIAHQRRELALEMLEEVDEHTSPFDLVTTLSDKPEMVSVAIRKALGVTYDLQTHWRDPMVAFRLWRSRIEELGVLVFQASRIPSEEASGFAFWAELLPFMVVNGKDTYARRTFSLIHELTHLMLRQSGVSDLDAEGSRSKDFERIEIFCNQVAAATLMPQDLFLAEQTIVSKGAGVHDWSEEIIKSLATTFSVSREAIVRRLIHFWSS